MDNQLNAPTESSGESQLALRSQTIHRFLYLQGSGFLLIVCLVWLDEVLHLPALILGIDPEHGDWRESAIESILISLIAIVSLRWSYELLQRICYLEGFARMCSWCRKVQSHGKWMTIENYLAQEFDTDTSHGICEHCAAAHFKGVIGKKKKQDSEFEKKTKTA